MNFCLFSIRSVSLCQQLTMKGFFMGSHSTSCFTHLNTSDNRRGTISVTQTLSHMGGSRYIGGTSGPLHFIYVCKIMILSNYEGLFTKAKLFLQLTSVFQLFLYFNFCNLSVYLFSSAETTKRMKKSSNVPKSNRINLLSH